MSNLLTLEAFRTTMQERLEKLYDRREQQARAIDASYGELIAELRSLILRGGKRFRPYLTYLMYTGLGGESEDAILDLAASQELLHNFLIIHDDVFDHDVMRYGGLNVAGSYRLKLPKRLAPTARHHLANSMAIMGGDVTMGFVLNQVLDSDFSAELKLKALQRIEKMIFEVAGGEVLDVLIPTFDLASVTEDRLLQTYRYKTASYSFEAPMQLGAILAGADASLQTAMSEVALPLGVAFQLVDDLLGVFGNETEIGKSVLSDLREGKRTLLIVKGLELADEKGQQVIGKAMGNRRAGYSDLGEVRTILSSCGAKTYVEELAKAKVNLATVSISKLGLSETVEAELRRLSLLSIQHHA